MPSYEGTPPPLTEEFKKVFAERERQYLLQQEEKKITEANFYKITTPLPKSEIFEQKELTTLETWTVIFWSFYYSRGSEIVQSYLLEYFRRHYNFSKNFDTDPIPPEILERTVKYVGGDRHPNIQDVEKIAETTLLEEKKFISGNIDDLNSFRQKILGREAFATDFIKQTFTLRFSDIYTSTDEQLLERIAMLTLSNDYRWQLKKNPNSHINDFYLNQKPHRAGPMFSKLYEMLLPKFQTLESSQMPVNDIGPKGALDEYPLRSNQIFQQLSSAYQAKK